MFVNQPRPAARATSAPCDWCTVTWEMTAAWQSGSLGKKKKKKKKKKALYRGGGGGGGGGFRSGGSLVVLCRFGVLFQLPAAGPPLLSSPLLSSPGWGDPEMMRGELLLLLLRLHVASSLQAALLLAHPVEPWMIDVYTFFSLDVTEWAEELNLNCPLQKLPAHYLEKWCSGIW